MVELLMVEGMVVELLMVKGVVAVVVESIMVKNEGIVCSGQTSYELEFRCLLGSTWGSMLRRCPPLFPVGVSIN